MPTEAGHDSTATSDGAGDLVRSTSVLRNVIIVATAAILLGAGCSNQFSFNSNDRPVDLVAHADETEANVAPTRTPAPARKPISVQREAALRQAVSLKAAPSQKTAPVRTPAPTRKPISGQTQAALRKPVLPGSVAPSPDREVLRIVDSDAGSDSPVVADLARIVGADRLDVRPVQTRGVATDLLALMRSEVDLGIVPTNALQSLPTEESRKEAGEKLQYIAGLYTKDLHVLALRELTDMRQLHQRKVNIGPSGSATNWTARQLFAQLGIEPAYDEVDHTLALEALSAGQIDAAVLLERRPAALLRDLPKDARFHLLGLPYEDDVAQSYIPGRFDEEDYPNLVDSGRRVETIAIGTVLVVPKVPERSARDRRLARFTTRFFNLFRDVQQHGDPLWAAVQPSVIVKGWRRYKPAEELLQKSAARNVEEEAETYDKRLAALTRCTGPHESTGLFAPALSMCFAPRRLTPPASTARGLHYARRCHHSLSRSIPCCRYCTVGNHCICTAACAPEGGISMNSPSVPSQDSAGEAQIHEQVFALVDAESLHRECFAEVLQAAFSRTLVMAAADISEIPAIGIPVALGLLKVASPYTPGSVAQRVKVFEQHLPGTPIIVIGCGSEGFALEAIKAGARGVLLVTDPVRIAIATVRLVLAGGIYYPLRFPSELLSTSDADGQRSSPSPFALSPWRQSWSNPAPESDRNR